MTFLRTTLRNGTSVAINLDHVENVYRDGANQAAVVMLPADGGQRVFEVAESYRGIADAISARAVTKDGAGDE